MITVLYICSESKLDGAALSLLSMIESVKYEVKPIVLCIDNGETYKCFMNHGIECYVAPHLIAYGGIRNWSHFVLHPWHLRIIKQLRYKWCFIRLARKKLSQKHIDLVHTNVSATTFGVFVSKILKVKHVWHVRECLEKGTYWDGKFYVRLSNLKNKIDKADARITISNACSRFWGLKKYNTWTQLDAVRSIKDLYYVKEKQPYLLFCSYWINDAKGAKKVIESFGKSGIYDSYPTHIRLKIVGCCEDSYKKELTKVAEYYNCSDFIDFIPVQEDVKPFFANAKAFINPSINEGMGRTTAEAMFYGCPVIAHASGGTLDLIKDGETGYLFHTVDECTELIKKVCTENQDKIILQAQEFAKQNLSVEKYGKKILEVYNLVLN